MCDQKNGSARGKKSHNDDITLPGNLSLSDDSEPEEESSSVPFHTELKDLTSSSSSDDDDDGDDGGGKVVQMEMGRAAQTSFSLKGGSSSFSSRSHSIFECLDSVAKLTSSALGEDNVIDGVFARPAPPPPRPLTSSQSSKTVQPPPSSTAPVARRGVPDYLAHPERWTYYNLEDVALSSEGQNNMAAHTFLSSLQHRKQELEPRDETEPLSSHDGPGLNTCSSPHKILFSRPGRAGSGPAAESESKPAGAGGKERGMSLTHLEEEEEEAAAQRRSQVKEERDNPDQEEDSELRAAGVPPGAGDRKRKWAQQGEAVEEESPQASPASNPTSSPAFSSFRKTNRKNYRKSTQHHDN